MRAKTTKKPVAKKAGVAKVPKVARRAPKESAFNSLGGSASHAHHHHGHESEKARREAAKKGAKTRARRKLAGTMAYDGCAVRAVADSLLLATGLRVSDGELKALFAAAGGHPEHGAVLADVLAAAMLMPLSGRPRLARFEPVRPGRAGGRPLVVGLDLTAAQADQDEWDDEAAPEWGPHAVAAFPGGVLSWGREIPVTDRFLAAAPEAWAVQWLA